MIHLWKTMIKLYIFTTAERGLFPKICLFIVAGCYGNSIYTQLGAIFSTQRKRRQCTDLAIQWGSNF